jgi:hypothetical protein
MYSNGFTEVIYTDLGQGPSIQYISECSTLSHEDEQTIASDDDAKPAAQPLS